MGLHSNRNYILMLRPLHFGLNLGGCRTGIQHDPGVRFDHQHDRMIVVQQRPVAKSLLSALTTQHPSQSHGSHSHKSLAFPGTDALNRIRVGPKHKADTVTEQYVQGSNNGVDADDLAQLFERHSIT